MFQLQPIEPYHLIFTNQLGFRAASQPEEKLEMAGAHSSDFT